MLQNSEPFLVTNFVLGFALGFHVTVLVLISLRGAIIIEYLLFLPDGGLLVKFHFLYHISCNALP